MSPISGSEFKQQIQEMDLSDKWWIGIPLAIILWETPVIFVVLGIYHYPSILASAGYVALFFAVALLPIFVYRDVKYISETTNQEIQHLAFYIWGPLVTFFLALIIGTTFELTVPIIHATVAEIIGFFIAPIIGVVYLYQRYQRDHADRKPDHCRTDAADPAQTAHLGTVMISRRLIESDKWWIGIAGGVILWEAPWIGYLAGFRYPSPIIGGGIILSILSWALLPVSLGMDSRYLSTTAHRGDIELEWTPNVWLVTLLPPSLLVLLFIIELAVEFEGLGGLSVAGTLAPLIPLLGVVHLYYRYRDIGLFSESR